MRLRYADDLKIYPFQKEAEIAWRCLDVISLDGSAVKTAIAVLTLNYLSEKEVMWKKRGGSHDKSQHEAYR